MTTDRVFEELIKAKQSYTALMNAGKYETADRVGLTIDGCVSHLIDMGLNAKEITEHVKAQLPAENTLT